MAKKRKRKSRKARIVRGPKRLEIIPSKDLLTLKDMNSHDIEALFKLTNQIRKKPEKFAAKLKGKTLGLLFQKPSIRTRLSFEVGMAQLGGTAIYLNDQEVQMGQREPVKDVSRTVSRYLDAAVLRTYNQSDMEDFAEHASIPVINGLSDKQHPCQVLSDLYTMYLKYGKLKQINITYIGDSNNILHSLLYGATAVGSNLSIVTPRGYEPSEEMMRDVKQRTKDSGSKVTLSNNPFMSLKNAHIIYTDVWVSMGQERQRDQRLRDFQPFQVNQAIVSKALPDALVMHCLPARRDEEITDEVLEGAHSIVFDQVENKLHLQKAVLLNILTRKKSKR